MNELMSLVTEGRNDAAAHWRVTVASDVAGRGGPADLRRSLPGTLRTTMGWIAAVRRVVAVTMLVTVVSVALFGQGAAERVQAHADHDVTWMVHDSSETPPWHHDDHDPCLHDDSCGGGGALNMGGYSFVVESRALGIPTLAVSTLIRREPSDAPSAPARAGLERPPRLA